MENPGFKKLLTASVFLVLFVAGYFGMRAFLAPSAAEKIKECLRTKPPDMPDGMCQAAYGEDSP